MTKDEEIAVLKARIAELEGDKSAPISKDIMKTLVGKTEKKIYSGVQREKTPETPEFNALKEAQEKKVSVVSSSAKSPLEAMFEAERIAKDSSIEALSVEDALEELKK